MLIKSVAAVILAIFSQLLFAQEGVVNGDFVRLVDPLDEPEFYCFDLSGGGENLRVENPLQTHTCKAPGSNDQTFYFEGNRLKLSGSDRCIEPASSGGNTLPGSAIIVRTCSDDVLQNVSLGDDGKIRLGDLGYCLGAGPESTDASTVSHLWRTLIVVDCDSIDASLATWQVGLN